MLINPDIERWFANLQGQPQARGGSAPRGGGLPNYGSAALEGIVKPGTGVFGFNAPPINIRSRPTPIAPNPAERAPSGIPAPFEGISGGGRDLGGGAVAAGLGKLGAGVENAMKTLAAKRLAAQQAQDLVKPYLAGGASGAGAAKPGVTTPAPGLAPAAPAFPPIGPAGGPPVFTQPSALGTQPVPPIGAGGASLPAFAQGAPGAAIAQGGNLQKQIAQHIVNYAASKGVPPQTALGIAWFEGLNRSNPLAINPDGTIRGVRNTAIGPFQLGTAGLGKQLGVTADTPWQTQVEKSIDYMAAHGYGPWNSVGDRAGTHGDNSNTGPISARGADVMRQLGVSPGAVIAQGGGGITSPSAAAYAAAPPSLAEPTPPRLAGAATPQDTAPSEPRQISPGRPQTGPAYSDETWANRPQFDYGGGAANVPVPPPPGQQGMNQPPPGPQTNPLAAALAQAAPDQTPQLDQSALLAMALSQPAPDFGGFGGSFG